MSYERSAPSTNEGPGRFFIRWRSLTSEVSRDESSIPFELDLRVSDPRVQRQQARNGRSAETRFQHDRLPRLAKHKCEQLLSECRDRELQRRFGHFAWVSLCRNDVQDAGAAWCHQFHRAGLRRIRARNIFRSRCSVREFPRPGGWHNVGGIINTG